MYSYHSLPANKFLATLFFRRTSTATRCRHSSICIATRYGLEIKKIPVSYAKRRFITAFTRARHLSTSCAKCVRAKYTVNFILKLVVHIVITALWRANRLGYCDFTGNFCMWCTWEAHKIRNISELTTASLVRQGVFLFCDCCYVSAAGGPTLVGIWPPSPSLSDSLEPRISCTGHAAVAEWFLCATNGEENLRFFLCLK
jgi:hypothetical protein